MIHVCEVNQGGDRECECKNKALANARGERESEWVMSHEASACVQWIRVFIGQGCSGTMCESRR